MLLSFVLQQVPQKALVDSEPSRSSASIQELSRGQPFRNDDGCDSPPLAKAVAWVRPVLHDWSMTSQIKDRSLDSCTRFIQYNAYVGAFFRELPLGGGGLRVDMCRYTHALTLLLA